MLGDEPLRFGFGAFTMAAMLAPQKGYGVCHLFQPLTSRAGGIEDFESLARWNEPNQVVDYTLYLDGNSKVEPTGHALLLDKRVGNFREGVKHYGCRGCRGRALSKVLIEAVEEDPGAARPIRSLLLDEFEDALAEALLITAGVEYRSELGLGDGMR
ncbi:MAG TPA: hypothetical protein VG963_34330 [Polyangiaceae bacterium]|nr:hypothetical protein [Polyangiaceae bacterium]